MPDNHQTKLFQKEDDSKLPTREKKMRCNSIRGVEANTHELEPRGCKQPQIVVAHL